jgi:2,4-dienoyl-CoA reductase-like NADH-dependent reductase (Old Yellow Enzyme family)
MSGPRLFEPLTVGDIHLVNRIVIAPMCQYSAVDGCMTDWHLIHLGHLALSGAALLTIEATAVEARGRITYADVGLWDDATEAAMGRVLSSVRRHSDMPIALQLAHAGRKASTEVPWKDGAQIAASADGGWQTVAPVGTTVRCYRESTQGAGRSGTGDDTPGVCRSSAACRAPWDRCGADPLRTRLPAASIPLAPLQPTRR